MRVSFGRNIRTLLSRWYINIIAYSVAFCNISAKQTWSESGGNASCRAAQRHHWLARINVWDENKCREHLEAAEKFATQYDGLPDVCTYTSPMLNGHKGKTADTSKNYTETRSELLLNDIRDSHFDPVREKDWFKELEARLSENITK